MTILILFHKSGYRCLKHYYLNHICTDAEMRKRSIIETINDELKNIAQVEHSRHRSFHNFVNNLMAGIAAYSFFPKKPMLDLERVEDKQLTIF